MTNWNTFFYLVTAILKCWRFSIFGRCHTLLPTRFYSQEYWKPGSPKIDVHNNCTDHFNTVAIRNGQVIKQCVSHSKCWRTFVFYWIIGERDAYRGNTIEIGDVCLFIYNVWIYVCHLVLWPSRIFMLAGCSTPSQTSLNRNLQLSIITHIILEIIFYHFEFFCGCS